MDSASTEDFPPVPRGGADSGFLHNLDLVISGKWLGQFCVLTKELSSPTRTRFYQARKVSWEILIPGTLFWTLPLRCAYSRDPLASCSPCPLLAKDSCHLSLGTSAPPTAASEGWSGLHCPGAEWGGQRFYPVESGDSCPCPKLLLFPPLPGKYPNLFHSSFELAREIPPSKDRVRSPQAEHLPRDSAANLTFKAARAGPRPAPVLVPAHSFRAGPHAPARAALQAPLPRAMPAAHVVPNPVLLLNLTSNLKRVFLPLHPVGLFFTPPPVPFD